MLFPCPQVGVEAASLLPTLSYLLIYSTDSLFTPSSRTTEGKSSSALAPRQLFWCFPCSFEEHRAAPGLPSHLSLCIYCSLCLEYSSFPTLLVLKYQVIVSFIRGLFL